MRYIHAFKSARIFKQSILAASVCLLLAGSVRADLIISEVHSTGSSNSTYIADWFELTNTGAASINIAGWKVDDNSAQFANAVGLRGVSSIAPGQSVVFAEGDSTGTNDAAIMASFINAWWNGSAPAGFTMGGYGGSQIGLSSTTDAVNIYNSGGSLMAGVSFGAATTGKSFDNAVGASGAISTVSAVGVNGAFTSFAGGETGSPGTIGDVPEPGSALLLVFGAVLTALGTAPNRRRVG